MRLPLGREEEEIAAHIGADWIEYQDTDDLEESVRSIASPDCPLESKYSMTFKCFSFQMFFFSNLH